MWIIFAILSAVFAALTSILAKVGIEGVDSNLATAVRTVVVVAMAWIMVFITNAQSGLLQISRKSWIFLILSGIATGASWLCYYRAIQVGQVSRVVPIDKSSTVMAIFLAVVLLGEGLSLLGLIGGISVIGIGYVRGEMSKEYRINSSIAIVARRMSSGSSGSVPAPSSSKRIRLFRSASARMETMFRMCAENVDRFCSMLCSSPMSAYTFWKIANSD